MAEIWVAFITGLTTGGLSCMAVQGGLLASSLANQIEQDLIPQSRKKKQAKNRLHIALPILLFLAAKLAAYTLIGLLLGALGSVLQLTPMVRSIMQFTIGIFMIGNALRMLNVHPIFRFFTFEPPASVTRYIRRKSKNGTSFFTPLFLGALTVFIPCGVTQSVMAGAVATGSPAMGAALLFAFVLGTSPVFFLLSYFATRLGALMEKYFMRFTALVLLVLGILAFDTGLNLMGSPYSLTRLLQIRPVEAVLPVENPASPFNNNIGAGPFLPTTVPAGDEILVEALNNGYKPGTVHAPANTAVKLNLVTNETYSCSRAFVIPELNVQEILPASGTVQVFIPAQDKGKVMPFACSMGMYTGQIIFDR
jgi:sulfite exporter TauE/SafE